MNPYFHLDLGGFFSLFISRFFQLAFGRLAISDLASDEVQFFVLAAVGAMGALLGPFLILRKQTMLANALSHTLLFGIVGAYLLLSLFVVSESTFMSLPILFGTALFTGFLTTFLTQFIHKVLVVSEEAAIGLVFTTLFAIGVLLLSLYAKNLHLGPELITGNVDALQQEDLKIFGILTVIAGVILLFFKELTLTTFDPTFARAKGMSNSFYSHLLMTCVAMALIIAFRAVGVLMGLAFFVGPPLIARLYMKRLLSLIALSAAISWGTALTGIALSRHLLSSFGVPLSTSGLIVSLLFGEYVTLLAFRGIKRRYQRSDIREEKSEKDL